MGAEEEQIREAIERWTEAVHAGDLETVLADRSEDVAFAHALLRCGTPAELGANPDNRLRLTAADLYASLTPP